CATLTPTRSPVYMPGPIETNTALSSLFSIVASCSNSSIRGRSSTVWWRRPRQAISRTRTPSSESATEASSDVGSIESSISPASPRPSMSFRAGCLAHIGRNGVSPRSRTPLRDDSRGILRSSVRQHLGYLLRPLPLNQETQRPRLLTRHLKLDPQVLVWQNSASRTLRPL